MSFNKKENVTLKDNKEKCSIAAAASKYGIFENFITYDKQHEKVRYFLQFLLFDIFSIEKF